MQTDPRRRRRREPSDRDVPYSHISDTSGTVPFRQHLVCAFCCLMQRPEPEPKITGSLRTRGLAGAAIDSGPGGTGTEINGEHARGPGARRALHSPALRARCCLPPHGLGLPDYPAGRGVGLRRIGLRQDPPGDVTSHGGVLRPGPETSWCAPAQGRSPPACVSGIGQPASLAGAPPGAARCSSAGSSTARSTLARREHLGGGRARDVGRLAGLGAAPTGVRFPLAEGLPPKGQSL